MLQSAPTLNKFSASPAGILANAPRMNESGLEPMPPRHGQALRGAPLMQRPQGQRGPFDEQIPGEMDQMGQQQRKGPSLGNIVTDFIINYGAASDNPLARSVLAERAALDSQRKLWEREDGQRQEDRQWQLDDAETKANAPDVFMSGKDRVRFDPTTGQASVLYDAPEAHEAYAASLGLTPGTPEHTKAMQDYVLRSSGPTAYGFDMELDDYRTNNDIRRKGAPTYRQSNPAPVRARSARSGRPSAGVKMKAGERSITTANGETQVVRGGKWVTVN